MKPTYINNELNVSLEVFNHNGDWYISFQVDNSYTKVDTNKVAITKWLLKTWKEVQLRYKGKTLYCEPWSEDGHGLYRFNAFTKLGFIQEDRRTMVIEL